MLAPRLKDYDIRVLSALGNNELNDIKRNQIKLLIIEKLLKENCSMFFLVNSFVNTSGILKEAYAEVITIIMKESDYKINDTIIDDIVSYVSLDGLIKYGAESKNSTFSEKCSREFWDRVPNVEDKVELIKKSNVKRKKRKK